MLWQSIIETMFETEPDGLCTVAGETTLSNETVWIYEVSGDMRFMTIILILSIVVKN